MARQQRLDRLEIVVEQVLVIDLIERQILDDPLHVEELHDKHAIVAQGGSDAVGDGMKLFQVKEDAGRIDRVKLSSDLTRGVQVEKRIERRYARIGRDLCRGLRR